jgi:hypothetical protein
MTVETREQNPRRGDNSICVKLKFRFAFLRTGSRTAAGCTPAAEGYNPMLLQTITLKRRKAQLSGCLGCAAQRRFEGFSF